MSESITIKSPHEIEIRRQAAKIAAGARSVGRQAVKSGMTTKQIDRAVHEYIIKISDRITTAFHFFILINKYLSFIKL